ncbi:MAG: flippase [Treponema sp.]|nr:flippase [Treponema sp.]
MKTKSLKKNALYGFIRSFMNIAFPIITFPYASRVLMPENIGKVNFANSIVDYFLMLAALGISTYATREATKLKNDKPKLNQFVREIIALTLFSTLISATLLFTGIFFISRLSEYRLLIILIGTKLLFNTMDFGWLFVAEEDQKYITLRSILFQIISLIALFTFVHSPKDYIIYAIIGVFSSVGSNIYNLIYTRKYVNIFEKTEIHPIHHLKGILVFFGNNFAIKLYSMIDTTMVGLIIGNAAVGYYTAANKVSSMVSSLIKSSLATLMPRGTSYFDSNKQEEFKNLIKKSAGATSFFAFPAALGLTILSKPVIIIFCGENYLPAQGSMQIMSLLIILYAINSMVNNLIIVPLHKEKILLTSQIAACITDIIFNAILIPTKGVWGASLATFIAQCVMFSIRLAYVSKWFFKKEIILPIIQVAFITLLMSLCVYFVYNFLEMREISLVITTLLSIIVGVIAYTFFSLLFRNKTAFQILQILKGKVL